MAKEAFYFSHDYNARADRKLMKLQMSLGMEGIGIYWCVIEMLYEEGGCLMLSECERIAFELRTTTDSITKVVLAFDLFKFDDEKFWSESINRRLEERKHKSEKAKNSAYARWKQNIDANELQHECDSNAIKERKGKDMKEKKEKEAIAADAADFGDYEKWCEQVIQKNDHHFETLLMNERLNPNGTLGALARDHLGLLAEYPNKRPSDQHRYRLSLLKYIRENLKQKNNAKGNTGTGNIPATTFGAL